MSDRRLKSEHFTLRIPSDLALRLEREAARARVPKSRIIVEALRRRLPAAETAA